MQTNTIINVLGAIVTVALVTTIVQHTESKEVIKSFGEAFSSSIKSAIGN